MSQNVLPSKWLTNFSDPYAVLGVSVAADDRRVLKRYRAIAKLLHPDRYTLEDNTTKELASQLFARLVNPAYQKLKQEKGRKENASLLRLRARQLYRDTSLNPQGNLARQLIQQPISEVDVFYEQAITQLAESQYEPLEQFESLTQQLGELNLVYSQLKVGETLIREKPTGIVPSPTQPKVPIFSPPPEVAPPTYSERHYRRAQEYMKKSNWKAAEQELRDAIKIEAGKSEYHALLGVAYLQQNLQSMAKVYMRQALKLNAEDPLALKFASKLGIEVPASESKQHNDNPPKSQPAKQPDRNGGLFGLFRAKK
ncbi:J domain-containing protein [Leptolyngbya sp. FACHB-321]|uniref:J domain-containing protein n=1 Tax=Leptolyngbya sp. FACHB-321 TaxID=2692807 RepID=UPI001682834F|nr:J domain-containing protein [Leptolyngbya sp. FACHB-321]MBD2038034.1 J domain-containing protein [Leptolyngbya sp. FACHB-321]